MTRSGDRAAPGAGEGTLKRVLTMIRWPLLLLGFALLVLAVIFISRLVVQAAPSQPIAFDHSLHNQAGIQCLYCHPNAMRSDVAGIPSVQKCMSCHQTIATERPAVQALAGYWERQEPIPWNPVNKPLDFVYFSHQPHGDQDGHGLVLGLSPGAAGREGRPADRLPNMSQVRCVFHDH